MSLLNDAVSWYQHKIGTYDKQHWERSVEQQVIKNIQHVPKKATKVKPELIDVDLVRGSTFTKAKPQHNWMGVVRRGILRVLFLPLYFRWWQKQTSFRFFCLLLCLYSLQVAAGVAYVMDSGEHINDETLSVMHLLTPVLLMLILGMIHSQIVSTHISHKQKISQSKDKRKTIKPKRKKVHSKYRSSLNSEHESGTPENAREDETFSQYKQRKSRERAFQGKGSDGFVKFETDLKSKLNNLGAANAKDENGEENTGADSFVNHKHESLAESISKIKVPKDGSCTSVKPSSARRKSSSGFSDCNMTYKSVDGSEDITCNSYEDPDMLNEPIIDCSGELCVDVPNEFDVIERGADASAEESPEELDKFKDNELSYIPSDQEQDHGSINLVGIKTRKQIGQKLRRRHVTSNKVDDLTHEVTGQPGNVAVTDPLVLNDLSITTNGYLDKDSASINGVENIEVDDQLNSSQNYIPSAQHTDCGKIDLLGIKKRTSVRKISQSNDWTSPKPPQHLPSNISKHGRGISSQGVARQHEFKESTGVSSCESDAEDTTAPNTPSFSRVEHCFNSQRCEGSVSTDETPPSSPHGILRKGQTSEMEWEETINTDESTSDSSGCSSDSDYSDKEEEDPFGCTNSRTATHTSSSLTNAVMNSIASDSDKVSVIMWEDNEVKKVDLSVLDIGWTIIRKVDSYTETSDYLMVGMFMSLLLGLVPAVYRGYLVKDTLKPTSQESLLHFATSIFGCNWSILLIVINGMIQRICLGHMFFFILSVAERTFKQRLQYAKHFCYLTSSRRARKYELPHFRLNKVRNIKTWLSLRSYLKKRGPQRSVDIIVSAAFILNVILVSILCIELLKSSEHFVESLSNWELVIWCMALGIYLLRFMTLGTKINKKYRNFSVLITEQINLYLHMEQKPHKKEELLLANSVLKLAEDLIKELESPFKISGLSANPFLYNITKVVILSAFSAVLTELVGFKLKLYKIKLKA